MIKLLLQFYFVSEKTNRFKKSLVDWVGLANTSTHLIVHELLRIIPFILDILHFLQFKCYLKAFFSQFTSDRYVFYRFNLHEPLVML